MFLLMNEKVVWGSVIAAVILSMVFYPFLPADMPIHYDVTNSPDLTVNKLAGTAVLPALMIVFALARKANWQLGIAVYILLIGHAVILFLAV
ncbi:DUF1648 domain-containing protein [Bacillus halotolerans]|uniref:DUF1648 domain-containing protein n=1 Tax=Bacillus halotolerans TaxID=260554 RepID=UPI0040492A52